MLPPLAWVFLLLGVLLFLLLVADRQNRRHGTSKVYRRAAFAVGALLMVGVATIVNMLRTVH